MPDSQKPIKTIDQYLKENNLASTNPMDANRYLSENGILKDSSSRPGLPLRNKLRDEEIPHAYQKGGKNSSWVIPHSYYGPFYNPSYLSKDQFKEGLKELAKDSEVEILKAFFHFENYEANGAALRAALGKSDTIDINREVGNLGRRLANYFEISHFLKEKGERMKLWNVCFQGRREGQWFIWILREELKGAMFELGLDIPNTPVKKF